MASLKVDITKLGMFHDVLNLVGCLYTSSDTPTQVHIRNELQRILGEEWYIDGILQTEVECHRIKQ